MDDMRELQENPTELLWEVEIMRILAGEREARLMRVGGAEGYVEVMLAESRDHVRATVLCRHAFANVVQAWHPTALDKDAFVMHLLDLIHVFTPDNGFIKVLEFAREETNRSRIINMPIYGNARMPYLKALVVLSAYFPMPPMMNSSGYRAYVALLKGERKGDYAAHAQRRLQELGE